MSAVFGDVGYDNVTAQDGVLATLALLEKRDLVDTSWGATGTHCWLREFIDTWLPENVDGQGANCSGSVTLGRTSNFTNCVIDFIVASDMVYQQRVQAPLGNASLTFTNPLINDDGSYVGAQWSQDLTFTNGVDPMGGLSAIRCWARHKKFYVRKLPHSLVSQLRA